LRRETILARVLKFGDWFRYVALALLGILVLLILVQADAVMTSGDAVGRSMRYDMAMTGQNGRLDMTNARETLARSVVTRDPLDVEAARLFYEILVGRLEQWQDGAFGDFVDASADRSTQLRDVARRVEALAPLYRQLPDPEAFHSINAVLADAARVFDKIGGEAMSENLSAAGEFRQQLYERQRLHNILLQILIGFGAGLLLLMSVQAWSLERARADAERAARRFEFVARHDPLTRLPNRSAFHAALQEETARQAREGETDGSIAVFALDLDGFKAVNDILGHAAGDDLLVAVAGRIGRVAAGWGPGSFVSRLGGDEFTVLLRVHGGEKEALEKALQISSALHETYSLAGGSVVVNATIGISLDDGRRRSGPDLLQDADIALSHAKANGKGQVQLYDASMRIDATRRRRIEADFDSGLGKGQITAHFQPQVNMETGEIVGVEALARWRHPALGWIPPSEFIPIAEGSGRIVEIGERILELACREVQRMPIDCTVSVNLSVVQLAREDLADRVSEILRRTGLPPQRLTLEVTESVVMRDTRRAAETLGRLKRLGIAISLDDFGTGYSALSYLRAFDWDELKIDRSFVRSIASDEHSLSIIASIVGLAEKLSIKVTVEGVETRPQVDMLKGIGCLVAQGFYFGVPASISDILRSPAGTRRIVAKGDDGDSAARA
jgi:diguanylate cyclase (GGDEF)-like protein